jgi:hypothetical protein
MAAGVFAKLPLTTIPFRPVAPEPNFMSVGDVLKYHKGRKARKAWLSLSIEFRALQRRGRRRVIPFRDARNPGGIVLIVLWQA